MFASTIVCICGKRREEKRVQIVCKKGGCANFVQIKLTPESVQTLCKDFGLPWRVAGLWRGWQAGEGETMGGRRLDAPAACRDASRCWN